MLSIVNCIKDKHDLWLVLVAAIICFLGSWAVMRIFRRGRSATGLEAVGWLFLTATAAGASIWAIPVCRSASIRF
jgi:NO-binding membrane sensor protein with MHYT domain